MAAVFHFKPSSMCKILEECKTGLGAFVEKYTAIPSVECIQTELTTVYTNLAYPPTDNQIILVIDGTLQKIDFLSLYFRNLLLLTKTLNQRCKKSTYVEWAQKKTPFQVYDVLHDIRAYYIF